MNENISKIIDDLGANYIKGDLKILEDIYDEISSIASNISNREKDDEKLFPYIKKAVKATYLARGGEGLNSINESGKSLSFDNIIEEMKNNIVKAGLRLFY